MANTRGYVFAVSGASGEGPFLSIFPAGRFLSIFLTGIYISFYLSYQDLPHFPMRTNNHGRVMSKVLLVDMHSYVPPDPIFLSAFRYRYLSFYLSYWYIISFYLLYRYVIIISLVPKDMLLRTPPRGPFLALRHRGLEAQGVGFTW